MARTALERQTGVKQGKDDTLENFIPCLLVKFANFLFHGIKELFTKTLSCRHTKWE